LSTFFAVLHMSQEPVTTRPDSLEHLNGFIERVTCHNGETGFVALQVKVRRDWLVDAPWYLGISDNDVETATS
jgi:hypothetical protein